MSALSNRELLRLKQFKAREEASQRREKDRLERELKSRERAAERAKDMRQHIQKISWTHSIEEAPVFRPSPEEFADPVAYILSIREAASKYGICKIIPPYPATSSCFKALRLNSRQKNDKKDSQFRFSSRQQVIRDLGWDDFGRTRFWKAPQPRSLSKLTEMADSVANKVFSSGVLMPAGLVESEYWRNMAIPYKGDTDLTVEYGDNVEGSGFSCGDDNDLLGSSEWNLNALPKAAKSTLRLLKGAIPGVTEPMLYFGMLFSTFSWHVEDLNLYSMNYHHAGAPKTWYGVPSSDADAFEQVVLNKIYKEGIDNLMATGMSKQDAERKGLATLLQKTTIFSPEHLLAAGVRTTRIVQHAGEFVLTFPRAYHSGFSNGYNLGEAVNFALRDWFPFGADCAMRMRCLQHLQAVPLEQLLCMEMEILHREIKAKADSDLIGLNDSANDSNGTSSPNEVGSSEFASWLLKNGDVIPPSDRPLVTTFCQLTRWHHRRAQALVHAGAKLTEQQFDNSVPCAKCQDMCYLSYVMQPGMAEPTCIRCCHPRESSQYQNGVGHNHASGTPGSDARNGTLHGAADTDMCSTSSMAGATVFCHDKLWLYHKLGAMYGSLAHSQRWALSEEEFRAQGLTDRLRWPSLSQNERDDYTAEDLNEEYEWHGSFVTSPNSCKSDTDILTVHDVPMDEDFQDALLELLPPAAPDLPLQPVPKKVAGKGARVPRKVAIKPPAKVGVSPPARSRKPSAMGIQYATEGPEAELSASLNAPASSWQGDEMGEDAESFAKAEKAKQAVLNKKANHEPTSNPARTMSLENAMSLDPSSLSRGQDEEEEGMGRGRKRRAAADAAVAMLKIGGRIAPEDALAEEGQNVKAAKKRKAALSGGKRSDEHSGDSNLGPPKGSLGNAPHDPQSLQHMGLGPNGKAQWLGDDGLGANPMMSMTGMQRNDGYLPAAQMLSSSRSSTRMHPLPPQTSRDQAWLAQLDYSASLNSELSKLLDYFCKLPPVEQSFPVGPTNPNNDASMDLSTAMNAPMLDHGLGGAATDRRRAELHNMAPLTQQTGWQNPAVGPAGGVGAKPTRSGSQRDMPMMNVFNDPQAQALARTNSQMLGHMNQPHFKMTDVDPLTSMTLPFLGGASEGPPASPASPVTGRGRPRSRQGPSRGGRAQHPANSGGGADSNPGSSAMGDSRKAPGASLQGMGGDQGMGRVGRGKLPTSSSPINMPSLATNPSMPGSMEMNVADFNDPDTGDFTDFMKLLGSDNHELEGML